MLNKQTNKKQPLILLVDDYPDNLRILGTILKEEHYSIAAATSGKQALDFMKTHSPDLILLDLQMPDMDGYQVCKTIKKSPQWQVIPIIFLTARIESQDIVKGLQCGAVDYICKPFNRAELLSRVKNHISLKLAEDKIIEQNQYLQHLIDEKNTLLEIVAHDLRNPLTGIVGLVDVLYAVIKENDLELLEAECLDIFPHIKNAVSKMLDNVCAILDLQKMESGILEVDIQQCNIAEIIREVLETNKVNADKKEIKISFQCDQPVLAQVDKIRIREIFDNLLGNAIKYSPYRQPIIVQLSKDKQNFTFIIKDNGQGFSEDDKKNIFKKYQQLSAKPTGNESSTGLGLSIVKKLVELFGGSIKLESQYHKGSKFTVTLPLSPNK